MFRKCERNIKTTYIYEALAPFLSTAFNSIFQSSLIDYSVEVPPTLIYLHHLT